MPRAALPVLRTPRLTLRPFEKTDADAITDGIANIDVSKWLSSVPYPYGRQNAVDWLAETVGSPRRVWAITHEDQLIGTIGVEPHLGYWLARPAWRQGFGFEAAYAAVSEWFRDPDSGSLLTAFFPGNDRSEAVLRALGFKRMAVKKHEAKALGQIVDAHEMRLTRDTWESRLDFTIYTDRLTIRPLRRQDAENMRRLAVPEVARNTSSFDPNWTRDEAEAYIRARRWRGLPGFMLAVEQDDRFIGVVGLGGTPVNVAYAFRPETWGQGIATEAMQAFLAEALNRFPINRLTADHHEDNPASGAVLRKLGFTETGRGTGTSKARLEPAPTITYAVTRDSLKAMT